MFGMHPWWCSCPGTTTCGQIISSQMVVGYTDRRAKKPPNTALGSKNVRKTADKTGGKKRPRVKILDEKDLLPKEENQHQNFRENLEEYFGPSPPPPPELFHELPEADNSTSQQRKRRKLKTAEAKTSPQPDIGAKIWKQTIFKFRNVTGRTLFCRNPVVENLNSAKQYRRFRLLNLLLM